MTVFKCKAMMKGANGKVRPKYFNLGDFVTGTPEGDYAAALNAANQITGALANVTQATISEVTLTSIVSTSAVAGAGDLFNQALVNVHLDAAGDKIAQVYIPAALVDIFVGASGAALDVVDVADAALVQYIQQLSQHSEISDGEQIDTTLQNGINSGKRYSQKYVS